MYKGVFMYNLDEMHLYLKNILSEERYNHSVRVMQKAEEYARFYKISVDILKILALSHDIAKEMGYLDNQKYVIENDLDLSLLLFENKYKLHGYVGADILEKRFGFTKEMGDAIREHTTANKEMSVISKILFLADKTEDGRKFSNIEEERALVFQDLDLAMLVVLKNTIDYAMKRGKKIDGMTIDAFYYFYDLVLFKDKSKGMIKVS